jgi:glycosyltransferase involved in cell wall biosynthesis
MGQMQLRILQILEKNKFDTGSVHQMFQAAAGLSARGHAVTVVSRPGAALEGKTREAGVAFHALPFRHELDVRSILGLRRVVEAADPHVIHVHKGLSHTLALAATWTRPVTAFVVNRGVSFPLTRWNRAKYRTKRVDRIVAVCEEIRNVVVRTGKVDPARVNVIYSGTDVSVFDPDRVSGRKFRVEKSIPAEAFLVMQVGVRDWKGWRELVDAFAKVAAARPDARLALVACRSAAERERVEAHARARGVADRVTAVEDRADMPDVLAAADCVVDASWSGTGVTGTIREAMAMARPVVATDCGGNRELVSSPGLGWLVPARSTGALASALAEVMEGRARAEEVGRAGRRRVVESFATRVRIDRLEALYRSIVGGKRPA